MRWVVYSNDNALCSKLNMVEAEPTKVCPLCAEMIKSAAKVCPHCRHWQKRWSTRNPEVSVALSMVMMFGVLAGFSIFFERIFGPKQDFGPYRDKVSVVSSQFNHRTNNNVLFNTVVGTITNRTEVAWKDVGVEAQFFDKAGKQIDAITVNTSDYLSVVVLPHGEAAFKIEGKAARPEPDYDSYKVTIRWARDARALF